MNPKYVLLSFCLVGLLLMGCTKQLITEPELTQLKVDKTALETKSADLQKEVDSLKSEVGMYKPKAQFWDQVLAAYTAQPYDPAKPDHKWLDLGDGTYLFMQFDKAVDQADELMYVGIGLPGMFCKEDQEQLPPSFTHFHQSKCASQNIEECHGGKGGDEGYWLMHVAVKDLAMPWGEVKAGVDTKFMPTAAPTCMEEEVVEEAQ